MTKPICQPLKCLLLASGPQRNHRSDYCKRPTDTPVGEREWRWIGRLREPDEREENAQVNGHGVQERDASLVLSDAN